jgi:hypothetical protein
MEQKHEIFRTAGNISQIGELQWMSNLCFLSKEEFNTVLYRGT